MKKILLLLITFFITQLSYTQGYIGSGKAKVKRHLLRYDKKHNYNSTLTETENKITFLVRDSSVKHLDVELEFNETGFCIKELHRHYCDSCYEISTAKVLKKKFWRWKKAGANTYLSAYNKHLILHLRVNNSSTYEISRISISRKDYRRMKQM